MAATVELLDPRRIEKNRSNPRLIFREDELTALADSIRDQGILVPLTVYKQREKYVLLDGERRWRCAVRLGLNKVPAIVQEKPDPVTNIMMMFAIHNARKDWDPLPTAMKLEELEKKLTSPAGKPPTIRKLAAAASMSPGEVRRLKKILNISPRLREELLEELKKPKAEQRITVDHAIEALDGAERLAKEGIIEKRSVQTLTETILSKFRRGILVSTVEPRKLAKVARATERGEITKESVRSEIKKFQSRQNYSIEDIYKNLVEDAELAHQTHQTASRLIGRLRDICDRNVIIEPEFADDLRQLIEVCQRILGTAT